MHSKAPDSSNATFFLMAAHSLDRTWVAPGDGAWPGERLPSSSAPAGTRLVYTAPRRASRRAEATER